MIVVRRGRSLLEFDSIEDLVNRVRHLIEVLTQSSCRAFFVTSVRRLGVSDTLKHLDRKLQMKLVELDSDRLNVKLRKEVEDLRNTRKELLRGALPLEIASSIIVRCSDARDLENAVRTLRAMQDFLGIECEVRRLNDAELVEYLEKFRSIEET